MLECKFIRSYSFSLSFENPPPPHHYYNIRSRPPMRLALGSAPPLAFACIAPFSPGCGARLE